jgi:hypothetical protein
MIQITPHMRIMVAVELADFRKGIDGLARLCEDVLKQNPFRGWVFVFRNQRTTALNRNSLFDEELRGPQSNAPACVWPPSYQFVATTEKNIFSRSSADGFTL